MLSIKASEWCHWSLEFFSRLTIDESLIFTAIFLSPKTEIATKKINYYFKCTQLMRYCTQGTLHCLVPREEDFLTKNFNNINQIKPVFVNLIDVRKLLCKCKRVWIIVVSIYIVKYCSHYSCITNRLSMSF